MQSRLAVLGLSIGRVLQAQGDLPAAMASYRVAREIIGRLSAEDPNNNDVQSRLAETELQIGRALQAQGNLGAALARHQAAASIRATLVAADPANFDRQRNLAVSEDDLGRVLRAQGRREPAKEKFRAALAVAERLAAVEPRHTRSQIDLAIYQQDLGYVLKLQGDVAGALGYYQTALTARMRFAEAAPDNKDLQSRLAYAYTTIGLVRRAEQNFDAALAAYREAVAIRRTLTLTDPSNIDWLVDLSAGLSAVGELEILRGDGTEGKTSLREALNLIEPTARSLEDKERASDGTPTLFTATAYLSAGWRALLVGDFERSLTASERALAIMPGLVNATRNRAYALMMLDRTEEARQAYRKMSSLSDPDDFKPPRQMLFDAMVLLRKAGYEHPLMNEVLAEPALAKRQNGIGPAIQEQRRLTNPGQLRGSARPARSLASKNPPIRKKKSIRAAIDGVRITHNATMPSELQPFGTGPLPTRQQGELM